MINISTAAQQALKENAVQQIIINIEPLTGTPFTVENKDILLNGLKIETHTLDGEELEIGNMNSAVLNLSLDNESGKFNGKRFAGAVLRVKIGVETANGIIEDIPLGKFTVDEQPRLWETISLEAYDNMVRMDIPYEPSTIWPNSLRNLVRECVEQSGLVCNDYSMFPDDYVITSPPKGDNLTCRQVAMWVCQCVCMNGYADENGDIKFAFYRKYTPEVLETESVEILESENNEPIVINGVGNVHYHLNSSERFINNMMIEEEDVMITGHQFIDDNNMLYPTEVNKEYLIETKGNAVFNALTDSAKIKISDSVNEAIKGFTYRAFTAEIVSLPFLQAGDSIAYHDGNGVYQTFITNWEYEPNGTMSISAKAKSLREKGYAPLGSLTPGQRAVIDAVNNKIDKTQTDLTEREQFLIQFNEAIAGSMGFYSTIKEQNDGSKISYMHDTPILEESQTIYTFGINGFAWTNDGWNNGSPVWKSGFDKNGNAILNAIYAYKLTADVIVSGMLNSRNGASWINMDDGTFCFSAVKDEWTDMDTGLTEYAYDKVLELADRQLYVYGLIKSLKYPEISASIGPSKMGDIGAFTVTDNATGYGDLFSVYRVGRNSDKGVIWTAPFLLNEQENNRKGISIFGDGIAMFADTGDVAIRGGGANISIKGDSICINQHWWNDGRLWFNYNAPEFGYSVKDYCFGNNNGGYGNIHCGHIISSDYGLFNSFIQCSSIRCNGQIDGKQAFVEGLTSYGMIIAGGDTYWTDSILSVNGAAKAHSWNVASDPNLKENIIKQDSLKALDKISSLKFYSYDLKKEVSHAEAVHTDIGLMANEAPKEIQSADGKGIDLYAYISMTAKAVQELSEKVVQQENEIAKLKAEIKALKQE